jgi:hypothetical protein
LFNREPHVYVPQDIDPRGALLLEPTVHVVYSNLRFLAIRNKERIVVFLLKSYAHAIVAAVAFVEIQVSLNCVAIHCRSLGQRLKLSLVCRV